MDGEWKCETCSGAAFDDEDRQFRCHPHEGYCIAALQSERDAARSEVSTLRARLEEAERDGSQAWDAWRKSEAALGIERLNRREEAGTLRSERDAALARADRLAGALEQADRWILYAQRVPDGACKQCFPGNEWPGDFVCAWHAAEARARAALLDKVKDQ